MRSALLFLLLPVACGKPGTLPEPPAPTRVEGELTVGAAANMTALALPAGAPRALELCGGVLAVAGTQGLYRAALSQLEALPGSTGTVRHLARRGAGLFVVTDDGLFHDSNGQLLRSPLSDAVAATQVRALDDVGEGSGEALWLTLPDGVHRARESVLTAVELDFERATAAPDLAVGVSSDVGVLVASGQLVSVDLAAKSAAWEVRDLPAVNAVARGDDGTVYLATAAGLYARAKDGGVRWYTFAAAGQSPQPVQDVFSAYGETLVAVGGAVAQLTPTGAVSFGRLESPRAHGLARDANGDTFMLEGSELRRLATGRPVSFAADVKPFLTAHCSVCHATGANDTPVLIDFTDLAVVKAKAPTIVARLTAAAGPATVMPPANVEVLTSNAYAVFLRWVAGGEQP